LRILICGKISEPNRHPQGFAILSKISYTVSRNCRGAARRPPLQDVYFSRHTAGRKGKVHSMPYIAVRHFPKDEETRKRVAERINQVFLEEWGCPPQAISISMEAIPQEEWEAKAKPVMKENMDNMMILQGEKKF